VTGLIPTLPCREPPQSGTILFQRRRLSRERLYPVLGVNATVESGLRRNVRFLLLDVGNEFTLVIPHSLFIAKAAQPPVERSGSLVAILRIGCPYTLFGWNE